jgi:DNA-binding YbaB/EbfC family protein
MFISRNLRIGLHYARLGAHLGENMFDPKKLMDMMKDAYQMQQQMQDELKAKTVQGASGGGMVTVSMNGQFEVSQIKIDPSLVQMNDIGFLEDMVRAAVNDAAKNAREVMANQMKSMTSKLGISL